MPEKVIEIPGHGAVAFPDSMTDAEINAAAAKLYQQANPTKGVTAQGSSFGEKVKDAATMLKDTAVSGAPTIGGIVGGAVGGPAGAAAGGAAGEGYKQTIQHAGELPGAIADVARNLVHQPAATIGGFVQGATGGVVKAGAQAAGQAAAQGAGELVAAGGSKLASWLMNRATSRVTAKLMSEFPELSDTLIDNALSVSKGGYDKALMLLRSAKAKAGFALRTADATGTTIPIELTPSIAESLKTALLEKAVKAGKLPVTPNQPLSVASQRLDAATKAIFADVDRAASGGTFSLTPSQADLLKTQLQKESRALYANRVAPNGQKAVGSDATELAEFASRLNDAIDGIASGYKAANAEAKPLIGAMRGIKQAIRPNGNLYQAMVRPAVGAVMGEEASRQGGMNPAIGGIAGAALASPGNMSREAIILAHPAMQAMLRQLPKPVGQMLVEFVATHLPDLTQAPTRP